MAILHTLAHGIILAAVLLWLLPQLGIKVPVGVVVAVTVAMLGFSALTYRPVKRAMQRKALSGTEVMVGKTGTAITDIAPRGQVRIQGEVWNAVSSDDVRAGEEVTIMRVTGLKLTVRRSA